MPLTLWTSRDLLATLTDDRLDGIPNHFLNTYFTQRHFSGQREIMLSELPSAYRTLAPFVHPSNQGKPIYREKPQAVRSFLPAYIKVKDPVTAIDVSAPNIRTLMGEADLTPQQKFDLAVDRRISEHYRAIETTWAWMASKAFIDAAVTISYPADQGAPHPEVTLTFGRDAGHTVVKGSNYWDNPATQIIDDVQGYADTMNNALRGGFPNRMYVGSQVAGVFRKNAQVKAQLDQNYRGNTGTQMSTGLQRIDPGLTYIGTLSDGLEVYSYKENYENAAGTMFPVLGAKDILLVAPGATGVMAFGAIYNHKAFASVGGSAATDIFPSMWEENDPSAVYLMHESAPLAIPLYPNRTFKATVLA